MTQKARLAQVHTLGRHWIFRLKASLLSFKRMFGNFQSKVQNFSSTTQGQELPQLAQSITPLWYLDDNELNISLTMGKVENLRVAARALNGLYVPAGEVFSFWAQLGYPSQLKGYVVGREIREGCMIPTVAGGLCQLSNGLYDAAVKAGFEIVERHRHSQVVKGSLAEQDRDATVKWNYIDFRFRAPHDVRVEVELSAENLIVTYKGNAQIQSARRLTAHKATPINDCFSCGNTACAQHAPPKPVSTAQTAYVLDERWPEYERYVNEQLAPNDLVILPFNPTSKLCPPRLRWQLPQVRLKSLDYFALLRGLRQRWARYRKHNVYASMLQQDELLALQYARRIPLSARHIVVSQNLLPFLWRHGALGGRTFDVLMQRPPIAQLQNDLDKAFQHHPMSPTLNDFRADDALQRDELSAIKVARRIVTPHTGIAQQFASQAWLLDWQKPKIEKLATRGQTIFFPASGIAKKGAYEIRAWAQRLGLTLRVFRGAVEYEGFWQGVQVEFIDDNPLEGVACVVFPTYIEHQPRLLLKALASSIPVLTSSAVGLPAQEHLTVLEVKDEAAWLLAIQSHLMAV